MYFAESETLQKICE